MGDGENRAEEQDYNVRLINEDIGRLTCTGCFIAESLVITSDRDKKRDFASVDNREILDRVATVPIQTWAFKSQPDTRHIGPVTQDFHAPFGVGDDDKHIATADADGMALAAIQGLYRIVKERDTEMRVLKERLEALETARVTSFPESVLNESSFCAAWRRSWSVMRGMPSFGEGRRCNRCALLPLLSQKIEHLELGSREYIGVETPANGLAAAPNAGIVTRAERWPAWRNWQTR